MSLRRDSRKEPLVCHHDQLDLQVEFLRHFFPSFFAGFDLKTLTCEACPLANQKRASFGSASEPTQSLSITICTETRHVGACPSVKLIRFPLVCCFC